MLNRDCYEPVVDQQNRDTSDTDIQAPLEDQTESPKTMNAFERSCIQISLNVMDLEFPREINITQIKVNPLDIGQSEISSPQILQNYIIDGFQSSNIELLQTGEEKNQEHDEQVSSDSDTLMMQSQAPWPLLQENTSFNSFGKTPDEQLELVREQSETLQKQESSSTSKKDSNQSAFFGSNINSALIDNQKKSISQTEPKLNEVQDGIDFKSASFRFPSFRDASMLSGVWLQPTLEEELENSPSITVVMPNKSSQGSSENEIDLNLNGLHQKHQESSYTSKTPTFPFDNQFLDNWIEFLKQQAARLDLEVFQQNDQLTQRVIMVLRQVFGLQIDDLQADFEQFLRSIQIKLSSQRFLESLDETHFNTLSQLIEEEQELQSKLKRINPGVLLYLDVALQVQSIYKSCGLKSQKSNQGMPSPGSDGLTQLSESIKINPLNMDFNFFALPQQSDLQDNKQFEEQKQFFNDNLTTPMINIQGTLLMGGEIEMPNSFFSPLVSKKASSIQHNESLIHHSHEVADQLKKLEEEEQSKINANKLNFNRKMDVGTLDLRGLSSDDESGSQSESVKQKRFRKPFNKFKEDKRDNINESADERQYQRVRMQAFHNLSPQFLNSNRETVKRKKQSKSKRDPADWKNNGEIQNDEFRRPQLNVNKSMTNAMSSFKTHEAMTDMQQRYMAFNSYIQAQNRIDSLVSENVHLQKLVLSSQHDLRLLQRFTRMYFKSMEFFKQKDILTDDAETWKVLMSCFQDKPVVLLAFSSPLVRKVENMVTQKVTVTEMPLLDFTKEFAGAVNGIQETRNAIKIAYVQATVEKLFQFCMDENPVGVHFSGHGVSNEMSMNGASCLVMETEDGCAHYLSEEQLTKFIKDLNNPLKFVFLSSCHSEFAGYLFHLAGVDHVICVKQNEEIYDKAAIILAKHFYNFLFSERNTVCKAFDRAKMFLSSNADPKLRAEANKFIMIKDSDDISDRIQQRLLAHNDISLGR